MTKPKETADVSMPAGKSEREALAELRLEPFLRHGFLANHLASQIVTSDSVKCSSAEVGDAMRAMAGRISAGDLAPVTNMLMSQGIMLDANATELMNRAWRNAGEYPDAFRSYMGLAMKAQAQSRATLEALAKIHQPREQIVRHVHVYEGGQAVVTEQLHMHGPGVVNAGSDDQSHAARAGSAGDRATLPSPNPLGDTVPIAGCPGEAQMSDARRHQSGRAARQPQRAQARPSNG